MKITVVGTGYVGLSIATLLSERNEVIALDILEDKVNLINKRISPISDKMITKYFNEKALNFNATLDKEEAYKELELDSNIPLILSFGGSGGQKKLNDVMIYYIKENLKNNIQIIHITGNRLYEGFMEELKDKNISLPENIKVLPYFYKMPEALNIAKLVITSAGAITLAEIAAVGVPNVLIPKGYTAENHQEYNAKSFEASGASVVILEIL